MQDTSANIEDLEAMLHQSGDAFAIVDLDLTVLWANLAFRKMTNVADTAGLPASGLLTQFEGCNFESEFRAANIEKRSFKVRHILSDNWYALTLTPAVAGTIIHFSLIEDSKETAEHVLLDEKNLRILINITEHPIWFVDSHYHILLCNDAFKKWITHFLGRELKAGDHVLSEDLDTGYLQKFRMSYELALTGKCFTAVEDMKVGNETKFSTINFNPVTDAKNVVTGISCFATDITDQRNNLSLLEAQNRLLLEIANIQSHKVRGPVSTLLGLVQVFNFEDLSDPVNIEVMNGVYTVTENLDKIVREVIRSINMLNKKAAKRSKG